MKKTSVYLWVAIFGLFATACGDEDESGDAGTSEESMEDEGSEEGTDDDLIEDNGEDSESDDEGGEAAGEGMLLATATYDGLELDFSCGPEFRAGEGNIKSYTAQIDVYTFQCRSSDGSTQVKLGFAAPTVGTTDYTEATTGISLGGITEVTPLSTLSGNLVTNQITFTEVESGAHLVGTFMAEWDDSTEDKVGEVSGSFDLMFE